MDPESPHSAEDESDGGEAFVSELGQSIKSYLSEKTKKVKIQADKLNAERHKLKEKEMEIQQRTE